MRLVSLLLLLLAATAAHADESCVRLATGSAIFSAPAKDTPVGRVTGGKVVASVDEAGAWTKVTVVDFQGEQRIRNGTISFYVPKQAIGRNRCPAPGTSLLTALDSILGLRWKDGGGPAGSVTAMDVVGLAAKSDEIVDLDGVKSVCFDDDFVPGLTVHVCGSCAVLTKAAGHLLDSPDFVAPGKPTPPPRQPCDPSPR